MTRVRVYWPDGSMNSAQHASAMLDIIAEKQEHEIPVDRPHMKRMLANRAFGWGEAIVDPESDDESFLKALGMSGMVFVQFGDGEMYGTED